MKILKIVEMFDPEFFPTPPELIDRMVGGMHLNGINIYEPSAGSGNIANYCLDRGAKVICAETNSSLRTILERRHKIVAIDHFDVKSSDVSHIDAIIANPPFSNADKHIAHMWEIAPDGCDIVSLCNETTVKNAYSGDRKKLNHLIQNYGSVEYLGSVFDTAERTTYVKVALVRLKKPGQKQDSFDGMFSHEADEEWGGEEGLLPYNSVRDVVQRYTAATKEIQKLVKVAKDLNMLVGDIGLRDIAFSVEEDGVLQKNNELIKKLQKNAWHHIFGKMKMGKYITRDAKEKVNKFVEMQENVPFTVRNVYRMMEVIVGTHPDRMDKALIDMFDRLTLHYHENRFCVEGWKTNSNYLIGKKFILPYMMSQGYDGHMQFGVYTNVDIIIDFVKAINHVTGKNIDFERYDWCRTKRAEKDDRGRDLYDYKEFGKKYDLAYWEVKGYKKGTMHFHWKDDKVWEMVNRRIAEVRGWELPEKI